MKFHIYCTYVPTDQMVQLAIDAEELGYDGVSFPDHVIYPETYDLKYPYTSDGRITWDREDEWPDPFVMAGAMASHTKEIVFTTGVFILAMRHPLMVAKALATIDALSGGRVRLGVGVGWMREEFDAVNADFSTRGRRTDEAIEVMRKIWRGEPVEHHGEFFDFPSMSMSPVPSRPVPIMIGGNSKAALRRAALLGDGMIPPITEYAKTKGYIDEVRRMREEAGRADLPFSVLGSAHGFRTAAEFREAEEIGIDAVRVHPFAIYSDRDGPNPGPMTAGERRAVLERYMIEAILPYREGR